MLQKSTRKNARLLKIMFRRLEMVVYCERPACIAAAIRKEVQQLKAAAASAKHAAESLRQLVRNHDTVAVVEKAGDPAWWVELLSDENEVVSNVAARAVRRLASDDANGLALIKAGAVPPLIRLISGGCDDSKAVADAALDKLANHGAAAVNAGQVHTRPGTAA
jgi:dihydropteroate synthase